MMINSFQTHHRDKFIVRGDKKRWIICVSDNTMKHALVLTTYYKTKH